MSETPPLSGRRPVPPGSGRTGKGGVRLALLALLVAVPLTGCATKSDVRDIRQEMREIAARQDSVLANMERLHRLTQDSLRHQSSTIASLRTDLSRQLLDLEDQILVVQELAGMSQRDLAQMRDQIEHQRSQIARGDPWAMEGVDESGPARDLFEAALTQFNRGSFGTARVGFEDFLSDHPNHALAPQARFYLAEIEAEQGNFEEAIERFLDIREYHPGADAVANAYYRIAVIYMEELGDASEARAYLERVVESYPDSEAAELARQRLQEIG